MESHLRITAHERQALLEEYRHGASTRVRLRAHILLLLAEGYSWAVIAVFQDEVDINTNPKIGAMWMRRGHQAELPTPGTNEKRYLAGSLNWRTGALLVTAGFPQQGRTAALFIRHLDDLRGRLRRY